MSLDVAQAIEVMLHRTHTAVMQKASPWTAHAFRLTVCTQEVSRSVDWDLSAVTQELLGAGV